MQTILRYEKVSLQAECGTNRGNYKEIVSKSILSQQMVRMWMRRRGIEGKGGEREVEKERRDEHRVERRSRENEMLS